MIRYIARPRAAFYDEDQAHTFYRPETLVVFEPDDNSRKTGIVDVRGNPIYAVSEIGPIGFMPKPE